MVEQQDLNVTDDDEYDEMDTSQTILPICTQEDQLSQSTTELRNAPDDGVIERIVLKDFMCHKHFELQLHPNVNFIVGQNGSGKSAIMTAIVMGLGGKASTTNRAAAMKSLIRSGQPEAEISLTLRNRREPYKPQQYGHSITVIRQIKREGGGIYKLKSSSGRIIENHKDELVRILDHFNIQIDNPVSMLSQDVSRNFLHSSSPKDKFGLFMKGTHLDQIANDYAKAEEQQQLLYAEINREMEMVKHLEDNAKRLEEEVREMDLLDNLEKKQEELSLEIAWAIVKESESKAEAARKAVTDEEKKLSKIDEKIEKLERMREQKHKKRDGISEALQAIQEEAAEVDREKTELENRKRELTRILGNKKLEGRNVSSEINKLKDEQKAFVDKLNECKSQSTQNLEGERKVVSDRKDELDRELREKNAKISTAQKDMHECERKLKEQDGLLSRKRNDESAIRNQIDECKDTLKRLESSQHNSLQVFGSEMIDICRAIDRNKQSFRKLPKGPIGSHVKVRDQNWVCAIEVAIGYMNLRGFVVDNQQDGDVLRDIIRQTLRGRARTPPHPPVFTSNFRGRQHDVSRNLPHCSYPTIMSMIEVNDPDIMNMLIDMCSVETSILIRDKAEARSVMGRNPPRNARNAYTIQGDQALPNYRYYSNKRTNPMGILQTSVVEGIHQQKRSLQEMEGNLNSIVESNEKMQGSLLKLKRDRSKIQDYMKRERSNIRNLEDCIEELKVRIEEIDTADQGKEDIATWEGIIQDLDGKIAERREQFNRIKEEMTTNNGLLREQEGLITVHGNKIKEVTDKLHASKRQIKEVLDDLEKINRSHQAYQDRASQFNDSLAKLKRDADKLAQAAANRAEQVSQVGPKVDTKRSVKSIQIEIDKIDRKLREEAGRRANQEEIKKKYLEAVEKHQQTDKNITDLKDSFLALQKSLDMRIEGYGNMRMRISNRARLYFHNLVGKRGYEGTLNFDVDQKKLDIIVKVDKKQATKNVSSLSGGERSFSTVSFIMALWEAIESPFRCLDEFDVFMDLMNRKISMKLMLEEAKVHRSKQFFFFTPQDMSALDIKLRNEKDCRMFRLDPPDRTQQTLN